MDRIEINQRSDTLRMTVSHRAQLFACYGMTYEYRSLNVERIKHSDYIITEPVG